MTSPRWIALLGVLGIPLGLFIVFSENIPVIRDFFAGLMCNGHLQPDLLVCATVERPVPYEVLLGNLGGGFVFGGVILIVIAIVGGMIFKSVKLEWILAKGEATTATILGMNKTGMRVNDEPLVNFRLKVHLTDGKFYEASTQRVLPELMIGQLSVGTVIPVKYNPDKPEDVAIDLDNYGVSATGVNTDTEGTWTLDVSDEIPLTEKLEELEKAYRLEYITKQQYEGARQRLLDEL